MSGRFVRILVCMLLCSVVVACGGGGGGGGGKKPPTSSTAPVDTDGDTHPDSQDLFPSDPKEWADNDKDGVGNNGDAFPNDASETLDTDKDGVGNNKDQFPNDATETVDTDKDGIGDNSDPNPMGEPIPAWPTYQGDAKHTGWVDVSLDTSNFKQRWSKPMVMAAFQQGAAGDGYIFFNNGGVLLALDARSGETLWTQSLAGSYSFNVFNQPAYADGIVYVQTGGHSDAFLFAFNAADGTLVFQTPLADQWSNFLAPTIVDGTVYIGGGYYGGMYAIDAKTGQEKWWQTLNQNDQFTPAISGNYAIAYTANYTAKLTVIDRLTGNLAFEIADLGADAYGGSMNLAPVVAGDYVLVQYNRRLAAFNLVSKQLAWEVKEHFVGQPVVKGERIYVNNNGAVETRVLSTGALVSSISGNAGNSGAPGFIGNLLVTNNLLFVRDEQNIYAYQVDTSALAWTLTGKSGAFLMAEGALVVFMGSGVVTIDLEGDIDADGLPDWWEKRLKKNIDPTSDTDGDGLTALAEFPLFTNPMVADTDGDGLSDGEEVTGGKSSPVKADTDGDDLNDYVEVKTHLTDPTKVDTDGDSLSDAEEIAAGLNPLDANDALADSDDDGYSNLHEVRANTAVNDAASRPQMTDWSMQGGNSKRNSYNPLMLNDTRFSERWAVDSYVSLYTPLTAGNTLIMRTSSTNQYVGWDTGTGAELWRLPISSSNYGNISTDAGKLVYFTNSGFNVLDAATGTNLLSKTLTGSGYSSVPLLSDGTLYTIDNNNRSFKAYSLTSGNLLWTSAAESDYYYTGSQHLLGYGQLIEARPSSLKVFSTNNGSLLKTITPGGNIIERAILGSQGNVIVQSQNGTLSSINISDGTKTWSNQECAGYRLAVGNGHIYALGPNKLCVFSEQTGALRWSLALPNSWGSNSMVLTASHLFYTDGNSTYGINLALKSVTWSIEKGASELAMGADGTLYLQTGNGVTAIDTEGDTDADGILQWWERRYGGDLVASADLDADGLTNLQEFTNKTNPLVADTDGDGLSDGQEVNTTMTSPLVADTDKDGLSDGVEVNTHGTDPLLTDSDGDGIDDSKEIALGLDALDEDDATDDNDSDGFNNREEIYSGTDHNNAGSIPAASDWAMKQANAAHNAFQPYRLDEDDFDLRWSKTFSQPILPIATGDNHIFVAQGSYSNASRLVALNAVDGKQQWKQELPQSNVLGAPTYSNGQVVLQTSSPAALRRFDADLGTAAESISFTGSIYYERAPTLFADNAYSVLDSGSLVATRLDTGATLWSSATSTSGIDTVLNNDYLFYGDNQQIHVLERSTGTPAFSISTPSTTYSNLVLGSRNNILAFSSGLVSYDIAGRRVNWAIPAYHYNNSPMPVAANGQVLYLNDSMLTSVNEVDGSLNWSWRPDNQYLNSNIIATLSHIFVANDTTTYALSASTGELLWSYNAGGQLALGADGALYIQSSQQLVAINLEGDSDSDGMPDWWERHYGLAANDASDAVLDLDIDGLTNLEEFTNGTYADNGDSDGDQLTDEEEVNTHLTDPASSDSDADGMRDDWEIANSFDPLDAADRDEDTDGDTIPNYFEFLVGTDPNDALSVPALFSAGTYSFEDGNLPVDWILSDDTTDVSIALNTGSQGTKSLQIRGKANISFVGFFTASDLSLDLKSSCSYAGLEVYIDDQLMASGTGSTTQWATLKTVIPLGQHTVSIRTNGYSCNLYVDNVVIAPAKTNTELGIQLVGLEGNQLRFVDASKTVVRSVWAKVPTTNMSARSLASIGNDKLVVAFSGNNETQLGVLDLATFNWRYFSGLEPLSGYYYSNYNMLVARGNFAYVATQNTTTGSIARVNLTSGAITHFGSHAYTSLALDSAGYIYAHHNGVIYKYDPTTLVLASQMNTVSAQQILIDSSDRLIVANSNEVIRYNAQRLVDMRVSLSYYARAVAVNGRDELLVANQNNQLIWYAADWQRFQTLSLPVSYLASFPQPDSDSDGLPDWWELAHGLDLADSADASFDTDGDDLTALQEFGVDTDPAVDDTDGDLLTDGDEINDFGTNPNLVDTDTDGLSDSDEVLVRLTNPLAVDTDADLVNDLLELTLFLTNPNDAASKPATLANFAESFESTYSGWVVPVQANAGWTLVADAASNGVKSLRANGVNSDQTAEIEWYGLFAQSTLTFDARVASENCCGQLMVYIDGQQSWYITGGQWQSYSLQLPAGLHTIRFSYSRYYGSASDTNTAWIDNIRVQ